MKKTQKRVLTFAVATIIFGILLGASSMTQADVITPIAVVASTEWSEAGTGAAINLLGPGITEVDPSDITTWTHANTAWNLEPHDNWFQWVNQGGIGATFDFDLGATFMSIEKAHIWNENGSMSWSTKDITLTFSDNAIFGDAGDTTQSLTLSQASFSPTYTGEHFALTPVAGVSHIRLTIDSAYPNNGIVGLAEVRFSGVPIPEPSTAILGGLGLMGVCFRRRRS